MLKISRPLVGELKIYKLLSVTNSTLIHLPKIYFILCTKSMLKSLKRSFGALMVSSLINYSRTRNRLVQKEITIFHQQLIADNDVRGQRKNDLSSPPRVATRLCRTERLRHFRCGLRGGREPCSLNEAEGKRKLALKTTTRSAVTSVGRRSLGNRAFRVVRWICFPAILFPLFRTSLITITLNLLLFGAMKAKGFSSTVLRSFARFERKSWSTSLIKTCY